jgi:hypothetical protein
MIMVGRKAIGATNPLMTVDNTGEDGEKATPVAILKEDIGAGISSGGYVVDSPGYSILRGRAIGGIVSMRSAKNKT